MWEVDVSQRENAWIFSRQANIHCLLLKWENDPSCKGTSSTPTNQEYSDGTSLKRTLSLFESP
jgi:hypothetical protein